MVEMALVANRLPLAQIRESGAIPEQCAGIERRSRLNEEHLLTENVGAV